MKNQIATTIEQSRHLLSCGVDPKTADMAWEDYPGDTKHLSAISGNPFTIWGVPAWSLSALLKLMPNNIMAENRKQFTFCLCKCKTAYIVAYGDENTDLYQSNGATAIEACVRLIETLTFHKHSLNKVEE